MKPSPTQTHTPGPWKVEVVEELSIYGPEGCPLAQLQGHHRTRANAHFIVTAVNSHEELLEATKEALCWLDPDCKLDGVSYQGEDMHSDRDKMIIGLYEAIRRASEGE